MVYQHALIFINLHSCLMCFLMLDCMNHAVARGFFKTCILTKEIVMQNEYGLGQGWCDDYNSMFFVVYFIGQCSSAWNAAIKVMLSLQDGAVECILAWGKSDILNMAKEILNVMEVLHHRPRWVWDASLGKTRRFWACMRVSNPLRTPRAGTMEGIKGRYY